jgi:hypothetical protein
MSAAMTFTIYVDGDVMAARVEDRLRELAAAHHVVPQIRVVDVAADPGAAEQGNVIGVPTVVREEPRPRRRVIGALDDDRRVADALGMAAQHADADRKGGRA